MVVDKKIVAYEDVPSLVQIEATYACNHNCKFCYNPKRDNSIDISKLDKIVESIYRSQIPHVYFIGGEPSLVPINKLNEYIEYLSEHSSVAMITNGSIRLPNLSRNIACLGIPIHGLTAEEHDAQTGVNGSFMRTIDNIKFYVSNGYDVRVVFVLTGYNHNKMYEMIEFVANLGVESVYIDRYEDGGFGAKVSSQSQFKPSLSQFREALGQIISARQDFPIFSGKIGFGTAIPMCIDERLITENLTSVCGAGTYFCAINPDGELRLCNQSEVKFGNIIDEPLEKIWGRKELEMYRDLSWVQEPCSSCKMLHICQCGCKVDVNCTDQFCVDFAVRGDKDSIIDTQIARINAGKYDGILLDGIRSYDDSPRSYRLFVKNRYLRVHEKYTVKKIITQYNTVSINEVALRLIKHIVSNNIVNEKELIDFFVDEISENEVRTFISQLICAGALIFKGEVA